MSSSSEGDHSIFPLPSSPSSRIRAALRNQSHRSSNSQSQRSSISEDHLPLHSISANPLRFASRPPLISTKTGFRPGTQELSQLSLSSPQSSLDSPPNTLSAVARLSRLQVTPPRAPSRVLLDFHSVPPAKSKGHMSSYSSYSPSRFTLSGGSGLENLGPLSLLDTRPPYGAHLGSGLGSGSSSSSSSARRPSSNTHSNLNSHANTLSTTDIGALSPHSRTAPSSILPSRFEMDMPSRSNLTSSLHDRDSPDSFLNTRMGADSWFTGAGSPPIGHGYLRDTARIGTPLELPVDPAPMRYMDHFRSASPLRTTATNGIASTRLGDPGMSTKRILDRERSPPRKAHNSRSFASFPIGFEHDPSELLIGERPLSPPPPTRNSSPSRIRNGKHSPSLQVARSTPGLLTTALVSPTPLLTTANVASSVLHSSNATHNTSVPLHTTTATSYTVGLHEPVSVLAPSSGHATPKSSALHATHATLTPSTLHNSSRKTKPASSYSLISPRSQTELSHKSLTNGKGHSPESAKLHSSTLSGTPGSRVRVGVSSPRNESISSSFETSTPSSRKDNFIPESLTRSAGPRSGSGSGIGSDLAYLGGDAGNAYASNRVSDTSSPKNSTNRTSGDSRTNDSDSRRPGHLSGTTRYTPTPPPFLRSPDSSLEHDPDGIDERYLSRRNSDSERSPVGQGDSSRSDPLSLPVSVSIVPLMPAPVPQLDLGPLREKIAELEHSRAKSETRAKELEEQLITFEDSNNSLAEDAKELARRLIKAQEQAAQQERESRQEIEDLRARLAVEQSENRKRIEALEAARSEASTHRSALLDLEQKHEELVATSSELKSKADQCLKAQISLEQEKQSDECEALANKMRELEEHERNLINRRDELAERLEQCESDLQKAKEAEEAAWVALAEEDPSISEEVVQRKASNTRSARRLISDAHRRRQLQSQARLEGDMPLTSKSSRKLNMQMQPKSLHDELAESGNEPSDEPDFSGANFLPPMAMTQKLADRFTLNSLFASKPNTTTQSTSNAREPSPATSETQEKRGGQASPAATGPTTEPKDATAISAIPTSPNSNEVETSPSSNVPYSNASSPLATSPDQPSGAVSEIVLESAKPLPEPKLPFRDLALLEQTSSVGGDTVPIEPAPPDPLEEELRKYRVIASMLADYYKSENFAFPSLPDGRLEELDVSILSKLADLLSDQELRERCTELSMALKQDRVTLLDRYQAVENSRSSTEKYLEESLKQLQELAQDLAAAEDAVKGLGSVSAGRPSITPSTSASATMNEALIARDTASRKLQDSLASLSLTVSKAVAKAEHHGALQQEVRVCNSLAALLAAHDRLLATQEREHRELEEARRHLATMEMSLDTETGNRQSRAHRPASSNASNLHRDSISNLKEKEESKEKEGRGRRGRKKLTKKEHSGSETSSFDSVTDSAAPEQASFGRRLSQFARSFAGNWLNIARAGMTTQETGPPSTNGFDPKAQQPLDNQSGANEKGPVEAISNFSSPSGPLTQAASGSSAPLPAASLETIHEEVITPHSVPGIQSEHAHASTLVHLSETTTQPELTSTVSPSQLLTRNTNPIQALNPSTPESNPTQLASETEQSSGKGGMIDLYLPIPPTPENLTLSLNDPDGTPRNPEHSKTEELMKVLQNGHGGAEHVDGASASSEHNESFENPELRHRNANLNTNGKLDGSGPDLGPTKEKEEVESESEDEDEATQAAKLRNRNEFPDDPNLTRYENWILRVLSHFRIKHNTGRRGSHPQTGLESTNEGEAANVKPVLTLTVENKEGSLATFAKKKMLRNRWWRVRVVASFSFAVLAIMVLILGSLHLFFMWLISGESDPRGAHMNEHGPAIGLRRPFGPPPM